MSSSCIPAGLRLDLEMVKAAAAAPPSAHSSPLRPAHSSASSTLSEASNLSSASLSLKRARTPRKRPNQTYNEAAALLASMYPSVFPIPKTAPRQLIGLAGGIAEDPSSSDLLPPLPVLGDAAFLLRDPLPPTPQSSVPIKNCPSPAAVSSVFREFGEPAPSPATPDGAADEPGDLDLDDDDGFDAKSIFGPEEGTAKGIDCIMGKLTMDCNLTAAPNDFTEYSSSMHPCLRSLMILGLGFSQSQPNIKKALRRRDDDSAWWLCPAVPVKDIAPTWPQSVAMPVVSEKNKKKSKKVVGMGKEVMSNGQCKKEVGEALHGGDSNARCLTPKVRLGLKLDTERVIKAWSNRGSVFTNGGQPKSPRSSADLLAKLEGIDLFQENCAGGGTREASVIRYKDKQCVFPKKIHYQVQNAHVQCQPRMKGRFIRSSSLHQALGEDS